MDSNSCNFQDEGPDTNDKTESSIECLRPKTEAVADTVNTFIKQEVFVNENVKMKQETKKEIILFKNEREIFPEEDVGTSCSNDNHSELRKVLHDEITVKEEIPFEFTDSLGIKHETDENIKSSSVSVFTETNEICKENDVKNITYNSVNINAQGQNKETISQQRTTHENLVGDCGTVQAYRNDIQGKFCLDLM